MYFKWVTLWCLSCISVKLLEKTSCHRPSLPWLPLHPEGPELLFTGTQPCPPCPFPVPCPLQGVAWLPSLCLSPHVPRLTHFSQPLSCAGALASSVLTLTFPSWHLLGSQLRCHLSEYPWSDMGLPWVLSLSSAFSVVCPSCGFRELTAFPRTLCVWCLFFLHEKGRSPAETHLSAAPAQCLVHSGRAWRIVGAPGA